MPKRINSITPRERDSFRSRRKNDSSRVWYISLFARLIIMALLIFAAVNIRIYYNQKAELLNRETARVERQIHELDREIENLKKRKEQLSSFANISRKNTAYKLGLRHADPHQIRRTVLIRRSRAPYGILLSESTKKSAGNKTAALR